VSAELFTEPDRNKTELTHAVTEAMVRYLDGLGFKPVETEVPICEGWIADAAGVIVPTYTEAVGMKLINAHPRCDYYRLSRDAAYKERYEAEYARVDAAYEALPSPMTVLVEVKTSRGDFRGDRKWAAVPPVNLCYLAIPRGLVAPAEYPKGWHVVEVSDEGEPRIAARSLLFTVPVEQQMQTVLALAVRRDHHTRHARLREFNRQERVRLNGEQSLTRVKTAMRAVTRIVKGEGESVEQVLLFNSIKNLPAHVIEELRGMWGSVK
jgi:hypothetical protein